MKEDELHAFKEDELHAFIEKYNESLTLEYKLRPNFHDIKESIEAIKKRMHFKILRTIYAFANTEGGELYRFPRASPGHSA